MSPEIVDIAEAEALSIVEGNMYGTVMGGAVALPESETTSCRNGMRRNLGGLGWSAVATAIPDYGRKSARDEAVGEQSRSRGLIVPMKRSTKAVMNGGGGRGGKMHGLGEGKRQRMSRTQRRERHVPAVACLRTGTAQPRWPATFDFRQEPGAGKSHAGICAGGGEKSPSLLRYQRVAKLNSRVTRLSNLRATSEIRTRPSPSRSMSQA